MCGGWPGRGSGGCWGQRPPLPGLVRSWTCPLSRRGPPGGENWGRIRLESGCQSHRVSLLSYKWSRVEKASMCNNFGDIVCSKCISKVSINDWQEWLNAYLTHSDFPGGTSGISYWFADIEKSLHLWDKFYLIMVYNLFSVLSTILLIICWGFCLYVHQWYWPMIFFFCCCILVFAWYQNSWKEFRSVLSSATF